MKIVLLSMAFAALASASAAAGFDDIPQGSLTMPKARTVPTVPRDFNTHNAFALPGDVWPASLPPAVDTPAVLQSPTIGDSAPGGKNFARGSIPRSFLGMDYYGPEAFVIER